MSDQTPTPEQLREDAQWLSIQTKNCGNPACGRCPRFIRAAAALEEQAIRLELEERRVAT